jgi:hypothetical protein
MLSKLQTLSTAAGSLQCMMEESMNCSEQKNAKWILETEIKFLTINKVIAAWSLLSKRKYLTYKLQKCVSILEK